MFRSIDKARGQMIPDGYPEFQDQFQENSSWKPTLRKISKGIFSVKDVPQALRTHEDDDGTSNPHFIPRNWVPSHQRAVTDITSSRYVPLKATYPDTELKPRPKGPRDPPVTAKGFNFVRRSFSRSKKREDVTTREIFPDSEPKELETQDYAVSTPKKAAYTPKHAASDFEKMQEGIDERRRMRKQEQHEHARPTFVYIPKHAASDFSKINVSSTPPISAHNSPAKSFAISVKSSPVKAYATPVKSYISSAKSSPHKYSPVKSYDSADEEETDYQRFLAESRIAAARTYNSQGIISPNKPSLQTAIVMNEIMANHRPTRAMSHRSSASRATSRFSNAVGSIYDKVADYYMPARYDAPRRQSIDTMSIAPSTGTNDREGSIFSRLRGSIRRSMEINRDKENDERMVKRERKMPVSPGLKKYNRYVKEVHGG